MICFGRHYVACPNQCRFGHLWALRRQALSASITRGVAESLRGDMTSQRNKRARIPTVTPRNVDGVVLQVDGKCCRKRTPSPSTAFYQSIRRQVKRLTPPDLKEL